MAKEVTPIEAQRRATLYENAAKKKAATVAAAQLRFGAGRRRAGRRKKAEAIQGRPPNIPIRIGTQEDKPTTQDIGGGEARRPEPVTPPRAQPEAQGLQGQPRAGATSKNVKQFLAKQARDRLADRRGALEKAKQEATDKLKESVKRKAKAGLKRGMVYIIDIIAGALDVATAELMFLVDFFLYIFTFSWLNLQMFYGSFFAKGKSKFIDPLTWDPIPLPLPNQWLYLALLAADILLIVMAITVIMSFILFFFTLYYLWNNPGQAALLFGNILGTI